MATHQLAVDREERVDLRSMLLAAGGRSTEIPESQDAYGWLVGSWEHFREHRTGQTGSL